MIGVQDNGTSGADDARAMSIQADNETPAVEELDALVHAKVLELISGLPPPEEDPATVEAGDAS